LFNLLYSISLKKIAVLILAAFFMSGCNTLFQENQQADVINTIDDGETKGSDATKIIVWGLFESDENLNPLFDRFEAEMLDSDPAESLDIEYVSKDKDSYLGELNTALNDNDPNTSPDIYMIHSSWLRKYESKISSIPANIISEGDISNDFHSFLSNGLVIDTKVMGVPLWVDLLGLVYNKDHLISDAGSTSISQDWNQFLIQAKSMTKRDANGKITRAGFAAGTSENVEFSYELMDLLLLQARNKPIDINELNVPYSSDEIDQIQEVLDWYRSFSTSTTRTWGNDQKLDTAAFIEGKLSAVVVPSWRILDILNYKTQYNLDLDLGVAQIPQLNASTEDRIYYPSYWIFVVSSDSSNTNNSHKLLEFITRESEQNFYIETVKSNGRAFAMLSPVKNIAQVQANESEYLKPYFDSSENGINWNMPDGELLRVQYEKLINGETNPEALLNYINDLNQP
jgi:ABC-type glycerol-3-phosphate transport system substrate-binding protein